MQSAKTSGSAGLLRMRASEKLTPVTCLKEVREPAGVWRGGEVHCGCAGGKARPSSTERSKSARLHHTCPPAQHGGAVRGDDASHGAHASCMEEILLGTDESLHPSLQHATMKLGAFTTGMHRDTQ